MKKPRRISKIRPGFPVLLHGRKVVWIGSETSRRFNDPAQTLPVKLCIDCTVASKQKSAFAKAQNQFPRILLQFFFGSRCKGFPDARFRAQCVSKPPNAVRSPKKKRPSSRDNSFNVYRPVDGFGGVTCQISELILCARPTAAVQNVIIGKTIGHAPAHKGRWGSPSPNTPPGVKRPYSPPCTQ